MIENIKMATKKEILDEMEDLEKKFNSKKEELIQRAMEFDRIIKALRGEMTEFSSKYTELEEEINTREGKNR